MKWPFSFLKKKKPITLFDSLPNTDNEVESLKAGGLASLALKRLKSMITEIGPRPAGSEQSRAAARKLSEDFKIYCDDTIITTHLTSPGRYYGTFKILALASPLLIFLCWIGLPYIALVCFAYIVYAFYKEFICYNGIKTGSLFPKKDITNVHATIEPQEEVTNTIIFSAHHDSAPIFKYDQSNKTQYGLSLYLPFAVFALTGLCVLTITILESFQHKLFHFNLPSLSSLIILIIFSLFQICYVKLWSFVTETHSPGAGDNLVSSSTIVELAHYFAWKKRTNKGLKHTRLVFVSFDGEEVGLIGSKAWYDKYASTFVNPININIDAPFSESELSFLTKDANGLVELDNNLAVQLAEQAEKMGYQSKVGQIPFLGGATDATSAARHDIRATTLVGITLDKSGSEPYHTINDTPEAVSEKMIERVISILIKFVENNSEEVKTTEKKVLLLNSDTKFNLIH